MAKILLVDDEEAVLAPLGEQLTIWGHEVVTANSTQSALERLKETSPNLVLTDIRLAGSGQEGLMVLRQAKQLDPPAGVIVMTGFATRETAEEAMKVGAYQYLTKPLDFAQLRGVIDRALAYDQAIRENTQLRRAAKKQYRFDHIIGTSAPMQSLFGLMGRVADSDTTILILGESGTGKELVANALHVNSHRSGGTFVPINCAALPENLLESELFGHKRGSFTGAVVDKKGLFEEADGGTIFLDEVSSLPLQLQGKLLRVLQEKEVRRVGENVSRKVNVRVVAASPGSLKERVKSGTFREDLYYRLSVIAIELPPLRERREDIPLLVGHFLKRRADTEKKSALQVGQDAMNVLLRYSWPGNVRELENALERGCALCTGNVIIPKDLPPAIVASQAVGAMEKVGGVEPKNGRPEPVISEVPSSPAPVPMATGSSDEPFRSLTDYITAQERVYIQRVLTQCHGDKSKAAQLLGVSLATLYRKLGSDDAEKPVS